MKLEMNHLFDIPSTEGFIGNLTKKIFKERSDMVAARKHTTIYLFTGTKRAQDEIKRTGFKVDRDGSAEIRIKGKQIWMTSRLSYAAQYGKVYLVKVKTSKLTWVENILHLFDEYVYDADIPASDVHAADSEEAIAIIKECKYLKARPKSSKK